MGRPKSSPPRRLAAVSSSQNVSPNSFYSYSESNTTRTSTKRLSRVNANGRELWSFLRLDKKLFTSRKPLRRWEWWSGFLLSSKLISFNRAWKRRSHRAETLYVHNTIVTTIFQLKKPILLNTLLECSIFHFTMFQAPE